MATKSKAKKAVKFKKKSAATLYAFKVKKAKVPPRSAGTPTLKGTAASLLSIARRSPGKVRLTMMAGEY